jgi:hypothetical protein
MREGGGKVVGIMIVAEEVGENVSALHHHLCPLVEGLSSVTPDNQDLLHQAELADLLSPPVWLGQADSGPCYSVIHSSSGQIPGVGAEGCAVLLGGVYKGVLVVVIPQLEGGGCLSKVAP